MNNKAIGRLLALALTSLVVPACSQGSGSNSQASKASSGMVPDFHLVDLNSISPTFNKTISPRDYLGMVPGFYFTHAN